MSGRNPKVLGEWGPKGARAIASESYWRQPLTWNRQAAKLNERRRVFCASLADVFEDREELVTWRRGLFDLIQATPHLDWLVLTKRPENVLRMMAEAGLYAAANPNLPCPQPNLWLGTSVEDQETADRRIPELLKVPAAVRFLSVEPLLESVDLSPWLAPTTLPLPEPPGDPLIDWVIVGGEGGKGARPCFAGWIASIVEQCQAASVPVFVKQWGGNPWDAWQHRPGDIEKRQVKLRHPKGGEPSEWPIDLRVREFPR